jgi:hypothetical protein
MRLTSDIPHLSTGSAEAAPIVQANIQRKTTVIRLAFDHPLQKTLNYYRYAAQAVQARKVDLNT